MKELNMVRVRYVAFAAALLVAASPLHAQAATQAGAPTESLADLLLKQAQTALDAFDRPNAERFARQILEQMTTSTLAQKQKARVILANVYYPEEAPTERKRAEALAVLKAAVRDNFELTIDRTLTWSGIDSILVEAKATTFGLAVGMNPQQEAVGPEGVFEISARASRASRFTVSIAGQQRSMTVADSSGGTEATLKIPAMRDQRPLFETGTYDVTITAIDKATGDTVTSRMTANVTAPALTFITVPVAMDSTKFLAERTKRYGWKGIIVGGLVAGSIYGFSNTLFADTTLKSKVGPDAKGTGIAALAGITVIAASFLDKGRPVPSAMARNQRMRDDFATSIRAAQAENASRIANYKTTFAITSGGR
jgi:hypothetical protein